MRLTKGDTYSIETKIGFGFLQYVETDSIGIDFVRVLCPINEDEQIDQSGVNQNERWNIGFPLKAAAKRKIISKVGNFEIPNTYFNSEYARSKHIVRSEFLGWHIIHKSSLKRELKKELHKDDLKLSPHGIMNDTLIIEYLEQNWKLENWR